MGVRSLAFRKEQGLGGMKGCIIGSGYGIIPVSPNKEIMGDARLLSGFG